MKYECELGPEGSLDDKPGDVALTVNNKTWYQILAVKIPAKGEYTLTCTSEDNPDLVFGVGGNTDGAAKGVVGGLLAFVLIPLVGWIFAIVMNIVIVVKRSRFRKRLLTGL